MIFDLYKPFRNRVAELDRQDSLYSIWAYSQFLQLSNFSIPPDIEANQAVIRHQMPQRYFAEWELEIIAKEIVLNCIHDHGRQSLVKWKTFSAVVNQLKHLEEEAAKRYLTDENILLEMSRLAHRQFIWQTNAPNRVTLARYLQIFGRDQIDTLAQELVGISVKSAYLIGLAVTGNFIRNPVFNLPVRNTLRGIGDQEFEAFFAFTSRPIGALRALIKQKQVYDDTFAYAYNDLRAYPLIRTNFRGYDALMCPIPTLLYWRLTSGFYYELSSDPRFANPFGASFQDYVGSVAEYALSGSTLQVIPEHEYGLKASRRASADWIIVDDNAALFVECKTKRLRWDSKVALSNLEPLKSDCAEMGRAITQLYKTILDYEKNRYQTLAYNAQRKIYPVVCTLENWHLFAGTARTFVDESAREALTKADLPVDVLERMPYSLMPVSTFEGLVPVCRHHGIGKVFDPKLSDPAFRTWEWDTYLSNRFPDYRNVYSGMFDKVIDELIKDVRPPSG